MPSDPELDESSTPPQRDSKDEGVNTKGKGKVTEDERQQETIYLKKAMQREVEAGSLTRTKLKEYMSGDVDINECGPNGRTPLCNAAYKGQFNVIKVLMHGNADGKADVNGVSKRNRSALWYAAIGDIRTDTRLEIIQFLLDADADIDQQSDDGNTPLMKAVEMRDLEAVKLLVERKASLKIPNNEGETLEDFAKQTSDPYLADALRHKSQKTLTRNELVDFIVGVVTTIIAVLNNLQRGVIRATYFISGKIYEKIKDEKIRNPRTVDDFKLSLSSYVEEKRLQYFFPKGSRFLETVAEKAAKLREVENMESDFVRDLTRLSLYQLVIFCDDSSSMKVDDRKTAQIELVKRIARITTRLVPDGEGVRLQFINHEADHAILDTVEAGDLVASVEPSGYTEIGIKLQEKILEPLVYQKIESNDGLKRPLLISVITDGCPSGPTNGEEKDDTFKTNIRNCVEHLKKKRYHPSAVRFQISRIGSNQKSIQFLDGLMKEKSIEKALYCTTDQLDEKYKELKENYLDLEIWLLRVLVSPITDRHQE
ncbi:hypothetical protein B0O99DRAFT_396359 [Bisporella sp. PMI_857]|nr:hypothetical protein B0O99DRAFT_396359 [Bisporella sp. PMI_857]